MSTSAGITTVHDSVYVSFLWTGNRLCIMHHITTRSSITQLLGVQIYFCSSCFSSYHPVDSHESDMVSASALSNADLLQWLSRGGRLRVCAASPLSLRLHAALTIPISCIWCLSQKKTVPRISSWFRLFSS